MADELLRYHPVLDGWPCDAGAGRAAAAGRGGGAGGPGRRAARAIGLDRAVRRRLAPAEERRSIEPPTVEPGPALEAGRRRRRSSTPSWSSRPARSAADGRSRAARLLRRSDPERRPGRPPQGADRGRRAVRGRVPDEVLAEARRVVEQADRRLALSGSATVVALAGATGSGKSSIFNALSGTDWPRSAYAGPPPHTRWPRLGRGVRRGPAGLAEDPAAARAGARPRSGRRRWTGWCCWTCPTTTRPRWQHRMEVDRLVQLVDMLIWVVDPQKYADAALHDRYLKPLAQHAERDDDRAEPGGPADPGRAGPVPGRPAPAAGVARASARSRCSRSRPSTGEGMDALRARLARQIADKQAAARRLAADVAVAAEALRPGLRHDQGHSAGPVERQRADHPGRRGGRGAGGDRGGRAGLAAAWRAGHRLAGAGLGGQVQARPAAPAAPGPAGRPAGSARRSTRPGWGVRRCRRPPACSGPGWTPRCVPWPTRPPRG